MREVCFLVSHAGEVLWSDASESPLALPDSRARWEAIWGHREVLAEIAHSHPAGPDAFSGEDVTTMAALDVALGRRLRFSLVTPGGYFLRGDGDAALPAVAPPWAARLRAESGMTPSSPA